MIDKTPMRQRYELFTACYRGRSDVVAKQAKDGLFKTITGGFNYERFVEHINQVNTYGIYNLDGAGNVGFILYDMDIFPRNAKPWSEMLPELRAKQQQVLALIAALTEFRIESDQILIEFPTIGYHVILPLAEPLPVQKVKTFAMLVLDRSGLRNETPFYPNEVCGYGDMVRLPLRLNSFTGRRSNFIRDIRNFTPADYDQVPDFVPLEKLRKIDSNIIWEALQKAN